MKKNLYRALRIATTLSLFIPSVVFGAGYVPLEPLPFLSSGGYGTNLPALLQAAFQLLIIGGAGVATLMITIGGIQYMTGDTLHQKAEGRARIQNSVFGLLLLLATYLLLRTINPQLLNFDISRITKVGIESNKLVQQAKQQSQAQKDAAAASPGPAASSDTSAFPGGGATTGSYVCPAGDVFCNGGSGVGATSGGGSSFNSPTPDFKSADYDSFPYAVQSSEPPPPVSTASFVTPQANTSGSEFSGTQVAPNTQDTYAYSGAGASSVRFFPDQRTCLAYATGEAQDPASACKKN